MNNSSKENKNFIYNTLGVVAVIILIALDQWTKMLAVNNLMNKDPFVIIENVFQLRYLENRGAAFGILQGQKVFFVVTGIIILVAIAYLYNKMPSTKKYHLLRVLAILMAAGAIGNMIDRVVNNYVVDFFYFELINFPIFNVADCYVSVAAALLIISIMFIYKEEDFKFVERRSSKTLGEKDDTK
jgi:signal peptidase II